MINTKQKTKLIVGVGSALVDILANETDAFLKTYGFFKGGMTLVDYDRIQRTLSYITEKPKLVPGGSACNTVIGIGNLGGRARFVGKLGKDEFADLFETDLKKNNVESILFESSTPTGRVLTIITPDAQRSMFTYLGASAETHPQEISKRCFAKAAIVHIEGYLIFNKDLMLAVLQSAQKAGARISLDLSSYTVVESEKNFLESIVFRYVDILIANEDEAYAFTGYSDEMKAIQALSKSVDIAVLKVGKRGSYIAHKEKITKIAAKGTGSAIDTTGAGDLWASGFLFGLLNNFPFEKCGELGSLCGYEVCQVIGTNIPEKGWIRIKNSI
jgi:sugar/nucleoside kinase (ribokinase family)